MMRGKAKEDIMTLTDFALILNASASVIAAIAQLVAVWRSP
jgi:hypothetical protein